MEQENIEKALHKELSYEKIQPQIVQHLSDEVEKSPSAKAVFSILPSETREILQEALSHKIYGASGGRDFSLKEVRVNKNGEFSAYLDPQHSIAKVEIGTVLGPHFSLSTLLDHGEGNNRYPVSQNKEAGLAYGLDYLLQEENTRLNRIQDLIEELLLTPEDRAEKAYQKSREGLWDKVESVARDHPI